METDENLQAALAEKDKIIASLQSGSFTSCPKMSEFAPTAAARCMPAATRFCAANWW
jgi:hypothetical protein